MLKRSPKRTNLKLHAHAHHLVRVLALALFNESIVADDACKLAGVERNTFSRWKTKGVAPDLKNLEALGQVVGLRLVWKPDYGTEENVNVEQKQTRRGKRHSQDKKI